MDETGNLKNDFYGNRVNQELSDLLFSERGAGQGSLLLTRKQASNFVQLVFNAHETNNLKLCDVVYVRRV